MVAASADGRRVLFDLRPYREELLSASGQDAVDEAATAALHPVRLTLAEGFEELRRGDDPRMRRSVAGTVALVLDNPWPRPRELTFETAACLTRRGVRRGARLPRRVEESVRVTGQPTRVRHTCRCPRGSRIVATVDGGAVIEWTGTHAVDPIVIELARR